MPHVFFLSYARPREAGRDTEPLIERFHRDLESKLTDWIPSDGQGFGFLDRGDIEAGHPDWQQRLREALVRHPIGVVLLSPDYVDSGRPWCRWEFQFLHQRNRSFGALAAQLADEPPRGLLVLNWGNPRADRLPRDFPAELQRVGEQIARGHEADVQAVRLVCDRGLRNVMELSATDAQAASAYLRFMQCLARHVAEQWDRHAPLRQRQLDEPMPPGWDGVGWTPAVSSGAAQPALPAKATRRMVYVVYLAARPDGVPPERRSRYERDGESDWQPFADGAAAQAQARHVDEFFDSLRNCRVEKWPFDHFRTRMDVLLERNAGEFPLLFVVDPWTTTQLDDYRQVLYRYRQLESDSHTICCPVVIWNRDDDQFDTLRARFRDEVEAAFDANRWEPVDDADTLADRLRHVVEGLQNRIRLRRTEARPSSGSRPPRISPT